MLKNNKKKRIRLKDIAQHSRVSISLVSRVLNNKMGNASASPEVLNRIRKSADALGYVPDIRARGLKTGKTYTIAVVMTLSPNFSTSIYTKLLQGIVHGGSKSKYHFLYQYFSNEEEELYAIRTLSRMNVDGILYAPVPGSKGNEEEKYQAIINAIAYGTKVVFCMENYNISKTYFFKVDEYYGGKIAAEYLISQNKSDISCFSLGLEKRLSGFMETLKEKGLSADIIKCGAFSFEEGYAVAMRYLKKGKLHKGIFAFSDFLAQGICWAIVDFGLSIEDYSVIGYDSMDIKKYFRYSLPSIRQPIEEVGRQSVKSLINLIENKEITSFTFLPELVL